MSQLLSPSQVAAKLHISERSVRRWCHRGELPAVKVGRQWRVRIDAIAERYGVGVSRSPVSLAALDY